VAAVTVAQVGLALEFLLVWAIVFVALPELYPSRARRLTTTLPFRVGVASLTTAVAAAVFFVVTGRLAPSVLVALAASTLVVAVVVTSRTSNWRFTTPYVSPTFAVLSSFVPTNRVTDFAALFRSGAVDPRARVAWQACLGAVTVGFVLVVGALVALPTLAFPALELLTIGGLTVVGSHRLFPAFPTTWRLRYVRAVRRVERRVRTARRLLVDLRGAAATLIVTTGFLLGTSTGALGVAIAASATRRIVPGGIAGRPSEVAVEWFVAVALLGYALSVGWFWWRTSRWLPGFVAADRIGRGRGPGRIDAPRRARPPGLLVPQTLLLGAALVALSPRASATGGAVALVATAVLLTVSLATPWLGRVLRGAALPRVPDRLALPAAFTVQWLGTALALVVLPGAERGPLAWTTAFVLVVGVGSYAYVDVRDAVVRRGVANARIAYLACLSAAVALLVWLAAEPGLGALFG
jgi:hypothetical protein